jgi:hypothetical protein
MLVDLCENVHIHTRELRQEFSVAEFFEHVHVLEVAAKDLRRYLDLNPEYEEGAHKDLIAFIGDTPHLLVESPQPNESAYFAHRLAIELTAPHAMGAVHLHWRDYRIHLSRAELRLLADALQEAAQKLGEYEQKHGFTDKAQHSMDSLRKAAQKKPKPGRGHFIKVKARGPRK